MKGFKKFRKVENNFVCWNCGNSFFYSPEYRENNLFCENCLNTGLSSFMQCIGKLFKVPTYKEPSL